MRTPSSHAPTKLRPLLLCTLVLACSALSFLTATPLQAQVLITDFESTEGFEVDKPVSGKGGWTIGNNDFLVVSNHAYSGSQSLRVKAGTAGRLDSPILVDQAFSGVSLWISNPDTVPTQSATFARFRLLIGDASGSQRVLQFQLRYSADLANGSYGLDYYQWVDDASVSTTKYFSTSLFSPTGWNEFRVQADFSGLTYSVWIGGTEIITNIAIGGEGVNSDSSIYQMQFWGHSATQTGNAYYDNITGIANIPEPSSIALLGGALVGGFTLLIRRKKVEA